MVLQSTDLLLQTHLYQQHQDIGAKFSPFAGYNMPLWYTTLKKEHLAVRSHVGMFDIGHMGVLRLSGPTAFADLQRLSCNDVVKTHSAKMVYSMILNQNGGILDDVMIGRWGDDYLIIVNASNTVKIMAWFRNHIQGTTQLTCLNSDYALLAIQGPDAIDILVKHINHGIANIKRFGIETISDLIVMRTGYTGEEGVELLIPVDQVIFIWQQLIQAGVIPCGLAARDSLRLEKGLPLYGQELSEEITPLMTRYQWVIDWSHDFIGKNTLLEAKKVTFKTTVGIKMESRHIPRQNYLIKEGGYITSGTLSPSLNEPIAMAIVNKEHAPIGTQLTIDIRGNDCHGSVVKVPFI